MQTFLLTFYHSNKMRWGSILRGPLKSVSVFTAEIDCLPNTEKIQ